VAGEGDEGMADPFEMRPVGDLNVRRRGLHDEPRFGIFSESSVSKRTQASVLPRRGWASPSQSQAARLPERVPQQELDLGVHAPELVVRPDLEGFQHLRLHPEKECLALRHGSIDKGFRCSVPAAPPAPRREPREGCSPWPPCAPRPSRPPSRVGASRAPSPPCPPRPRRSSAGRR